MSTINTSDYAYRLRTAREMANKSVEAMAKSLEISEAAYRDLEAFDDETIDCISLQQVVIVSKVLHLNLIDFFSDSRELPQESVSLEDLANKIKDFLITHHITSSELQDKAGWEGIEECLEHPSNFLKYNITALVDICETVRINWLSVISGICKLHTDSISGMKF